MKKFSKLAVILAGLTIGAAAQAETGAFSFTCW